MEWFPGITIGKDYRSTLDYVMTWTDWLNGDTISSYVVTVQAGLTLDSDSNTTDTVTLWLSGGTDGDSYTVSCQITSAAGRIAVRDVIFDCGEPPGLVLPRACS